MIRRNHLYTGTFWAWAVLAFGGTLLVFAGEAEPYVSPPPFVFGSGTPIVVIAGVWLTGWLAISVVRKRHWRFAGRRADLTVETGGIFDPGELVGEVSGRSVRAFGRMQTKGLGNTKSRFGYTVVEAELTDPVQVGAVVTATDGTGQGPFDDANGVIVRDDPLVAAGSTADVARPLISGAARDALLAVDRLDKVYVGNTTAVLGEEVAVRMSERMLREDLNDEHWTGNASTVTHATKGMELGGTELEAQVRAVAAVADAFERSTVSRSGERR